MTAGTYSIPVVATDNGTPALSVTHVYQVVVDAANRAPVVVAEPSVPGPFLAGVEGTFDVSDDFSDPDGDSLTYSLGTVDSAAAVMLTGNTVTVGTGATAGDYTVPVTAADSDSEVTHTYMVEVLAVPEVSIRAVTASVSEGTLATFQVVAEPPPGSALTVMLDVDDGAGDFIAGTAPTQVTVGTGGTGTFTVPTVDDRVGEADGRITATITTDSAYTVGMPSSATVTVTDDDDPVVSITAGASVAEGGDAEFTVTASKAPATSLIVNVSVDDGVGDFISGLAPQMVTIPANMTSTTLTISTVDDSMNEADGGITATLAPGTGYTVAAPPAHQATVTVSDDDEVEVRITAGDSPITEGEAATFVVTASTASASALTVNVNVVDSGSFLSGTAPTTVTIPARQTSAVLSVATQDDTADEPGGTITATVTASANYVVAAAPGNRAMVVVNDNDGTADPTVTIAAVNASVAEGTDATFTVTASAAAPTGGLTVNVSVTESGSFISGTPPPTVMIPVGDMSATLTVSTVGDTIDEADGTVTATLTSGTGYMVGASSSATVTVTDDDDPIVSIAAGASPVGEGTSALFEVSASTVQASDLDVSVNVAETVGFVPAGETGTQTVTIPSGESSVTLSVSTVDDRIDEADGTITATVTAGSGYTVAMSPDNSASVTVTDNDEAGITVTPTSGLTTTEAGGTATFTVVLDSQPTADVVISVSSSDTSEGTVMPMMLTFTDSDWDEPQPVTVTGVDDSDDEGTVDYTIMLAAATSMDPNYGGVDPADVSVSNSDDDGAIEPTVTITAGGGVTEGTDATFTVTASPAPTSNLTVNVSVTESGSFLSGTLPTTVMIPANMTTATLMVSTQDDSIDEMGGTITATLTPDARYRIGTPSSAMVAVTDDDTAGITVAPTSGLTTTEAGGQATFTVVLDSQPTASVSIGVSSSDTTEGTVSSTTLTFTSTTWDAAQTVTVTGVNDNVDDGDQTYTIELAAAMSTDPNYSGEDPTDVGVSNTDDDEAGITVTVPPAGLTTTEAGGTATFTVVLDSQPTASVSIGVSSSDTSEGTVLPTTLMFTDGTWDQPQTVTVTGVNDAMTDNDQTYVILLAAATSMDADYSGEDPDDVSVTNTDDDGPGITVTPTSGLTTTEAGGTATFTVVLNTQPTADVSIGVSSSDTGEGTVMPTSLTFMNTTWNNAQTVTVTGVNDDVFDGPQMYTIELAAASSTDTNYNNLDPVDVSVSNTDNDTAPTSITLTVQPNTLGEGDSATDVMVTATLDGSAVSTATTVALSLGGGAVNGTDYNATAPTITIAAEMATGTATFAITPIDDSDGEGDETIEIGGTATGGFSSTVNPVTVTLTDNDRDTMAPTLSTATVNGNTLVLTYGEALDESSVPAASAFTLGGTTAGVNTVAISGAVVTLTLSAAVASTDVVTVTYTVPTAPGANLLRDAAGNNADALTDEPVTNNTPAPEVSISADAASVTEGADVTFTVTVADAPTSDLTVNVSVTDSGSFISGTAPATVPISAGSTSATLTVNTDDDGVDEANGMITATVTTGSGYTVAVAPGNSAVVTVNDNDGVDTDAPMLSTAVVNGNTLVLTYGEALDESSVPAASTFTIGGPPVSVNTVTISGVAVTLGLSQAVTSTDVVTVSYTVPTTNPVRDEAGNDAGDLVDRSVTNDTPAGPTRMEQVAAREETLTSTLSGTGRLAVVATVDVLSTRFQQRVAGAGRRQSLTLAGKAVDLEGLRADGERHLAEALRDWRNVTLEDLMSSSAFELALTGDATGRGGGDGFVLWGQGDWLDFNSKPQDTFSMDGNVLSGHIGVDYQLGRLLLGMALGHSSGEVDYVNSATGGSRGTVDSEMLSLYPYVHFSPDGAGEDAVWAMVGFGVGDAEVTREGRTSIETDIEMRMFGLGVRTGVYAEGDLELALKADGFYAETESDAVDDLPSVDSDAVRGRLALELGHSLEQATGALDSSLELAARVDAGDAEEGVGGEVGIGVGYTSLLGLDIEVRGRYLVAHSEEDFDEWGASVTVRYDTTRTGGQGFTFELAPGWGDANSRADSMWGDTHTLSGTGRQGARSLGPDRLDLQMGYGLGLRGRAGLLTPFSELSLAGQSLRRARLGVRLNLPGGEPGADSSVQLELSGEHDAAGGRAADQRFELTATLRL